jgi:surfactin synthase thioesterase subunit
MPQLEGLADVARVVAPDLPGHGQSGGEPPRSIEESTTFVAGFLDALSVRDVVIGGHSMGGAVAQQFALTYPERVDGLVLVGTGARLRVLPRLLDLLATDYAEGVSLLMQMAVGSATPAALKASLHRLTAANPQRVVLGDLRACDVFDVMARIGTVRAPTLAICGEEDQLTPPRYSRFFGDRIAGSRVVVARSHHGCPAGLLDGPAGLGQLVGGGLSATGVPLRTGRRDGEDDHGGRPHRSPPEPGRIPRSDGHVLLGRVAHGQAAYRRVRANAAGRRVDSSRISDLKPLPFSRWQPAPQQSSNLM